MNCNKVLDSLYYSDKYTPLITRLLIALHIRHCPKCAAHWQALQTAAVLLEEDFFPPSESHADSIMALVEADEPFAASRDRDAVSLRAWIITCLALLFSLSSAYLGIDYLTPLDIRTINFMLPVGITVGGAITAFCAIFIGCHIKELSDWLGLHTHE